MGQPQSFTPWRDDQSPVLGTSAYLGPGPAMTNYARDPMDALRSGFNRDPGAMYPDGYLGTIDSNRNADKVAGHIWRSQRAYTRGVHKGERVDQSEYLWPSEFNLSSGIVNQMQTGLRYVSPAIVEAGDEGGLRSQGLVNDGKPSARDFGLGNRPQEVPIPDPARAAQLRLLAPTWS